MSPRLLYCQPHELPHGCQVGPIGPDANFLYGGGRWETKMILSEELPCHLDMRARWHWIPVVVTQPGEAPVNDFAYQFAAAEC